MDCYLGVGVLMGHIGDVQCMLIAGMKLIDEIAVARSKIQDTILLGEEILLKILR